MTNKTNRLERRVKARAQLMGQTLDGVATLAGVSTTSVNTWLKGGRDALTKGGRDALMAALGVDDGWLDSDSMEDIGDGLDELVGSDDSIVAQFHARALKLRNSVRKRGAR